MNVSVITEAAYREDRRTLRGAYEREWGGEPDVTFITAGELVDVSVLTSPSLLNT